MLRKTVSGIFATLFLMTVTLAVCIQAVKSDGATVFYDDFDGLELSAGWNLENRGGGYDLSDSILTIHSTGQPYDSMAIYRSYVPQAGHFTVSCKVKATSLSSFLLRIHAGPLPIFGSVDGAQLEFNSASSDHFLAVWWTTYWYWTTIYQPSETGVWYVLEMQAQRNPFAITYNVYNDSGVLLGTTTATNIGNFGYNDICYICLYVGAGGPNPPVYDVDWLKIEGEVEERELSIKLSGEHDYSCKEDVPIRFSALARDIETLEPVSNVDVTMKIYDPDGNLWISNAMVERLVGTGIYEWQTESTIRELKELHELEDGVYLVHVQASQQEGRITSDILQFHIDPPIKEPFPVHYYVIASLIIVATTISVVYVKHRKKQ